MADTAPVNGSYKEQVPSQDQQPSPPKADSQEIGWYFVEQYYTNLSKSPEKIHLFYSKKSQLVTGDEAEKVLPSVGQKAISDKIKDLGFQDCKVRVLNVDSQSSFNNIVVQVIGELSNKSEPHRKFVQTFVLAEQPNGYFVLNDIFRYLNDYIDEPEEEAPPPEEKIEVPHAKQSHESLANEEAAQIVDAKLEEVGEEPEESVTMNGAPEEEQSAPVSEPTEPLTTVTAEIPPEPEPSPARSPPKIATPAPSEAPSTKKTWANMVGAKAPPPASIPSAVAAQSKAPKASQITSQPAVPESIPSPASSGSGWQTADHGKKQTRPQPKANDHNTLAYIKNVNEKVDAHLLRVTLEKFGELKYFDVSRPKNSAFVEFADPTAYQAAVAANPHTIGTEQINVEERRPRPGAFGNQNYNRGGANAGRGRAMIQSRQGSQGGNYQKDTTRGSFQGRGRGNVTPKGRSQAQPV
ncbi:MAG: hypothetical protein Q9227_007506 [Pyrenula ochraceoflavens]